MKRIINSILKFFRMKSPDNLEELKTISVQVRHELEQLRNQNPNSHLDEEYIKLWALLRCVLDSIDVLKK